MQADVRAVAGGDKPVYAASGAEPGLYLLAPDSGAAPGMKIT